jgi:hypothetical protein
MDRKGIMSQKEDADALKLFIQKEVTKLFSSILDFAEVAVDGKERYINYRSKVLKLSNDAIREIKKEVDTRYQVKYLAPMEDVIVVKNPRKA